jgi:hypothetical protein
LIDQYFLLEQAFNATRLQYPLDPLAHLYTYIAYPSFKEKAQKSKMTTPEKQQRARYALHTPRLALRAVTFVLFFVSWALYIRSAVQCQDILNQLRYEQNLPSDQAVCWNENINRALRPFLLGVFALLWSAAAFVAVAVNKVGMHPGIDCAVNAIIGWPPSTARASYTGLSRGGTRSSRALPCSLAPS